MVESVGFSNRRLQLGGVSLNKAETLDGGQQCIPCLVYIVLRCVGIGVNRLRKVVNLHEHFFGFRNQFVNIAIIDMALGLGQHIFQRALIYLSRFIQNGDASVGALRSDFHRNILSRKTGLGNHHGVGTVRNVLEVVIAVEIGLGGSNDLVVHILQCDHRIVDTAVVAVFYATGDGVGFGEHIVVVHFDVVNHYPSSITFVKANVAGSIGQARNIGGFNDLYVVHPQGQGIIQNLRFKVAGLAYLESRAVEHSAVTAVTAGPILIKVFTVGIAAAYVNTLGVAIAAQGQANAGYAIQRSDVRLKNAVLKLRACCVDNARTVAAKGELQSVAAVVLNRLHGNRRGVARQVFDAGHIAVIEIIVVIGNFLYRKGKVFGCCFAGNRSYRLCINRLIAILHDLSGVIADEDIFKRIVAFAVGSGGNGI